MSWGGEINCLGGGLARPSTVHPRDCMIFWVGSSALDGLMMLLCLALAWMIRFKLFLGFVMTAASRARPLTFNVWPSMGSIWERTEEMRDV